MYIREDIRNIAIIAHVDHGKTTLVDALLKQSHTFRDNEKVQERVMDSNDLEKERGITILSKNTSVHYKDHLINIVDTPGHADFGGEVERVLKMVDSVLLVVDSYEGPMPQTKFVLKKALELGHNPIVVINKIDKKDARPDEVLNEVFDLFIELGASDEQTDFPVVYAAARDGIAMYEVDEDSNSMEPLFETIINKVKPPVGEPDEPLQMLVSTLDYSEYLGKMAIGKIVRGTIKKGMNVVLLNEDKNKRSSVSALFVYDGLKKKEVDSAYVGDIVCVAGLSDLGIGDTIADAQNPEALPFMEIDQPTLSMNFMVNDSPFAGKEGDFVTSRHLRDRLMKEIETNVSMRVKEITPDNFEVSGRGELHLSILIETMRREGYELQVSKPTVIYHEGENGERLEPFEVLTIDVPEEFVGSVIEKLGPRKAEMKNMTSATNGYTRLEFEIPSRGLIGFRNEFLTDTKGNGIMNSIFKEYAPYKGDIPERNRGSLVVFESGEAITYGLFNAQERGTLFIGPGTEVYAGMVCGECSRNEDIEVNVCKKKHLTNTRSSSSDEALKLTPVTEMSLENCLEFIRNDELVEVTPLNIRMRKKILDSLERKRASRK